MAQVDTKELESVLHELQLLGTEQTKKTYGRHGAREPLFGVTTGSMKPLARRCKRNYALSMALYATGNYDAMYFAGVIADPAAMTREDFELWMAGAYCQGLSDYVVAVTLAESELAQELSDKWIHSGEELYASAGWSCYGWLLGVKPDSYFDSGKLSGMLEHVCRHIHTSPNRVRYAMNGFVIAVGVSFLPLHEQALKAAAEIGPVQVDMGNTSCKTPLAYDAIQKVVQQGRLGFKRRGVRC